MRKIISWLVGLSLLHLLLVVVPGTSMVSESAQTKDAKRALKIKTELIKSRDAGQQILVKLRNGKEIEGHVVAVNEDSFTISDLQTRASQTILYSEVVSTKMKHKGLSTFAKIGIAGLAVGFIVSLVFVIGGHSIRGR